MLLQQLEIECMERRANTKVARKLRRSMTEPELLLWQRLRGRRLLGFKFRRQVPIEGHVADFASLEANLIVELDGSQHLEQKADDLRRTAKLQSAGFQVLRFWNDDVFLRLDHVLEQIAAVLRDADHCEEDDSRLR
jgi:very-short-patch-repair endonuclease